MLHSPIGIHVRSEEVKDELQTPSTQVSSGSNQATQLTIPFLHRPGNNSDGGNADSSGNSEDRSGRLGRLGDQLRNGWRKGIDGPPDGDKDGSGGRHIFGNGPRFPRLGGLSGNGPGRDGPDEPPFGGDGSEDGPRKLPFGLGQLAGRLPFGSGRRGGQTSDEPLFHGPGFDDASGPPPQSGPFLNDGAPNMPPPNAPVFNPPPFSQPPQIMGQQGGPILNAPPQGAFPPAGVPYNGPPPAYNGPPPAYNGPIPNQLPPGGLPYNGPPIGAPYPNQAYPPLPPLTEEPISRPHFFGDGGLLDTEKKGFLDKFEGPTPIPKYGGNSNGFTLHAFGRRRKPRPAPTYYPSSKPSTWGPQPGREEPGRHPLAGLLSGRKPRYGAGSGRRKLHGSFAFRKPLITRPKPGKAPPAPAPIVLPPEDQFSAPPMIIPQSGPVANQSLDTQAPEAPEVSEASGASDPPPAPAPIPPPLYTKPHIPAPAPAAAVVPIAPAPVNPYYPPLPPPPRAQGVPFNEPHPMESSHSQPQYPPIQYSQPQISQPRYPSAPFHQV
jgi:hypothetical protein